MIYLEGIYPSQRLPILLHQMPYHHSICVNLRVDAGTRREDPETLGVAHMVEHLLFQGTATYPSNFALISRAEAQGAEIWGATHTEYTSYWLSTPSIAFSSTFPVLLDMVRNASMLPVRIQEERKVILDEIAESYDDGSIQAQTLLDRVMWTDHPLGRALLGDSGVIETIAPERVQAFYRRHYTPGRMLFTFAGNLQEQTIREVFGNHWGDWQIDESPTPTIPPAAASQRVAFQQADHQVVHVMLGFILPPMGDPDFGAFMLLRTLLCEGMSSYLYTALRGDRGLCYSVDSAFDELRHATVFSIYVATAPETLLEVLQTVCQVLGQLQSQPIPEPTIARSRSQLLGRLLRDSDQPLTHARQLSITTYLTGVAVGVEQAMDQVRLVSAEAVQRAARTALQTTNLYAALVGPINAELESASRTILESRWATQ